MPENFPRISPTTEQPSQEHRRAFKRTKIFKKIVHLLVGFSFLGSLGFSNIQKVLAHDGEHTISQDGNPENAEEISSNNISISEAILQEYLLERQIFLRWAHDPNISFTERSDRQEILRSLELIAQAVSDGVIDRNANAEFLNDPDSFVQLAYDLTTGAAMTDIDGRTVSLNEKVELYSQGGEPIRQHPWRDLVFFIDHEVEEISAKNTSREISIQDRFLYIDRQNSWDSNEELQNWIAQGEERAEIFNLVRTIYVQSLHPETYTQNGFDPFFGKSSDARHVTDLAAFLYRNYRVSNDEENNPAAIYDRAVTAYLVDPSTFDTVPQSGYEGMITIINTKFAESNDAYLEEYTASSAQSSSNTENTDISYEEVSTEEPPVANDKDLALSDPEPIVAPTPDPETSSPEIVETPPPEETPISVPPEFERVVASTTVIQANSLTEAQDSLWLDSTELLPRIPITLLQKSFESPENITPEELDQLVHFRNQWNEEREKFKDHIYQGVIYVDINDLENTQTEFGQNVTELESLTYRLLQVMLAQTAELGFDIPTEVKITIVGVPNLRTAEITHLPINIDRQIQTTRVVQQDGTTSYIFAAPSTDFQIFDLNPTGPHGASQTQVAFPQSEGDDPLFTPQRINPGWVHEQVHPLSTADKYRFRVEHDGLYSDAEGNLYSVSNLLAGWHTLGINSAFFDVTDVMHNVSMQNISTFTALEISLAQNSGIYSTPNEGVFDYTYNRPDQPQINVTVEQTSNQNAELLEIVSLGTPSTQQEFGAYGHEFFTQPGTTNAEIVPLQHVTPNPTADETDYVLPKTYMFSLKIALDDGEVFSLPLPNINHFLAAFEDPHQTEEKPTIDYNITISENVTEKIRQLGSTENDLIIETTLVTESELNVIRQLNDTGDLVLLATAPITVSEELYDNQSDQISLVWIVDSREDLLNNEVPILDSETGMLTMVNLPPWK